MPARTRKRLGLAGLALCLAPTAGVCGTSAEGLQLSIDEAQLLAVRALQQNRPKLAYQLAGGVLEANPRDGRAHYTRALAFSQVGAHDFARKSARKAYFNAVSPIQKYDAAQLASMAAFEDNRLTLSQLWLRRAVHHAPDEEVRSDSIRAFRGVRARNPLNFDLRFSVAPSDNVNNGANSPVNIIEGSPLVGQLSPSAQAISGMVATTDLRLSYRIAQSERSATRLTGRAYARRVSFDDAVPGLSADDLSSSRLELGLSHAIRGAAGQSLWRINATGGRVWYASSPLYDYARVGVSRHQQLTDTLRLGFGGGIERQQDETEPKNDATRYDAFAKLSYDLAGGGRLGAYLDLREVDSNGINAASTQWTGVVSYTMGRAIGPAELRFSVGQSTVDYDSYTVFLSVPGGRVDESVFGGVTATFQDWSYLGFVPTVSVRTEKSRSNISRFDVDETSLRLGIRSEF